MVLLTPELCHMAWCAAVAFYGHYDIQPAEEPDWRTNPFEMTAVDGYLCGRGTSDNKGPMLAFIYAVKVRGSAICCRIRGLELGLRSVLSSSYRPASSDRLGLMCFCHKFLSWLVRSCLV